jgi:hypothetical protein
MIHQNSYHGIMNKLICIFPKFHPGPLGVYILRIPIANKIKYGLHSKNLYFFSYPCHNPTSGK